MEITKGIYPACKVSRGDVSRAANRHKIYLITRESGCFIWRIFTSTSLRSPSPFLTPLFNFLMVSKEWKFLDLKRSSSSRFVPLPPLVSLQYHRCHFDRRLIRNETRDGIFLRTVRLPNGRWVFDEVFKSVIARTRIYETVIHGPVNLIPRNNWI